MHQTEINEISVSKTTRKIGRTTYIVSSTYAESNQENLISVLARLIQSDTNLAVVANNTKSA